MFSYHLHASSAQNVYKYLPPATFKADRPSIDNVLWMIFLIVFEQVASQYSFIFPECPNERKQKKVTETPQQKNTDELNLFARCNNMGQIDEWAHRHGKQ